MKTYQYLLMTCLALSMMSATAPATDNYIISKEYAVTIQGTSNLHDWNETVGKVTGTGIINWNDDGTFNLNALRIMVDVYSIKSENSIMSNKTYKALKADTYPEIIFELSTPIKAIKVNKDSNIISANGTLTIAGVIKPVTMQVKVAMSDEKKLVFQGSQQINMSDYNVTPPTALFGALKTGDSITLNFFTNFVINTNL